MSEPDSVRGAIATGLAGKLTEDQVSILLDQVLAITKRTQADIVCKKCSARQRHYVDIPDARAVTASLADLLNQGLGSPGSEKHDTEIIVNRTIRYRCERGHDCDKCAKEDTDAQAD